VIKIELTPEQIKFALRVSKALHLAAKNADKLKTIANSLDALLLEKNAPTSRE